MWHHGYVRLAQDFGVGDALIPQRGEPCDPDESQEPPASDEGSNRAVPSTSEPLAVVIAEPVQSYLVEDERPSDLVRKERLLASCLTPRSWHKGPAD
jgi:hypothetical protein